MPNSPHRSWFEISDRGWRRLNAGRPLGSLLREAVQNAFDSDATRVSLELGPQQITVEDNGRQGFADERLVYTVFLTDKADSPRRRGRKGRGIKELISAMQEARVETIGRTIVFDATGRHVQENSRRRGTRLVLARRNAPREIDAALVELGLVIPPPRVSLQLNGRAVSRPRRFCSIGPCLLPTVVIHDDTERIIDASCELQLFQPRAGDTPQLFEMGLPVSPIGLPWHVDVGQRVPLADGRDRIDTFYRLSLLVNIFEDLVAHRLPASELRNPWVIEVLSQCDVSDAALQHYVRRLYPGRVVLGGSRRADDRARQLGLRVLDASTMPAGMYSALSRAIETSDALVNRRLQASEQLLQPRDPQEKRALALYEHLAQRLVHRHIHMQLMRKPADLEGVIDDATYDPAGPVIKINVEGHADLGRPLSGTSLAVLFHELAHVTSMEHDVRFIRALERVAGHGAALLATEAAELRQRFGV